jgi:two-component system, NarL family, response regulator LiaR
LGDEPRRARPHVPAVVGYRADWANREWQAQARGGDDVEPVRLALSNDYHIVLAGLAAMLEPYADRVQVVELTANRTMKQPVDVILYDTFGRLPEDDEKLEEIVASNDAKVVVYSWDSYPRKAANAHGAAGYIHKGLSAEELADAIVAIRRGDYDEAGPVPSLEGDETMPTWPGRGAGLSARESEVLTFIARGLSNDEIAGKAYLSINTVKTYIRSCYRKIGVTTRAQAVGWALRNGFEPD